MNGLDPLAIGTEVRLGRLARENAPTKSRRLLVEGRVGICAHDQRGVLAHVRGDSGETRRVVFDRHAGRWSCTCLARSERCSHVLAVMSVVEIGGSHVQA